MDSNIAKLLRIPFETGEVAALGDNDILGFFNACVLGGEAIDPIHLHCVQPNKSTNQSLKNAGYQTHPEFDGKKLTGALLACDKHKRLNENNFARAWNASSPGDTIIVAGFKKEGIASFKKFANQFASIEGQFAKHHGLVFWIRKPFQSDDIPIFEFKGVEGFITSAGIFSAEKIDRGSIVLAENFSGKINGNVADFGAGWGYLSSVLLNENNAVRQIDLYENNWDALQAARVNLEPLKKNARIEYCWTDITRENLGRKYNWIIMNPPFHAGLRGDPDIGLQFIEAAHRSLSPSGHLFMVANQHLPYEKTLRQFFSGMDCLEVRDGFKVLLARK